MDLATYQRKAFEEVHGDIGVASFRTLQGMKASIEHASRAQLQVLEGMQVSIHLLNVQLLELRLNALEQTSILREMLRRDDVQQFMEELVYNGQRMLSTFSDPGCRLLPVHVALLLRSFVLWMKSSGIGTEMIRGLENKKALGQLIDESKSIYRSLQTDSNVRDALEAERRKEEAALEAERLQEEEAARKEKETARLRKTVFRAVRTAISELGLYIGANSSSKMSIRFKTGSGLILPAKTIDVQILDDEVGKFVLWFSSPGSDCEAVARSIFTDARVLLAEDGHRRCLSRFEVS